MANASAAWTAVQVRALPSDGNRYEVVDGELLVTPSPATPHQRAVGALHLAFGNYLKVHGEAEVFLSPADVEFDARTLVQPDIFVVPILEGRKLRAWVEIKSLLLAIEVLSPRTARHDRLTKRRLYQRQGIEYWIVDLDAQIIERWRPGDDRPDILSSRIEWKGSDTVDPLVIDLEVFFEDVPG
ncbi:MAG: Uma2 family endonuclease [Gemmatimonadota bacterium]